MTSKLRIIPVELEKAEQVNQHMQRHLQESGRFGVHWLPYDPDDLPAPPSVGVSGLDLDYTEIGWERWFAVQTQDAVVGHLALKGARFTPMLHRCELAMGLEQPYWRQGIGQRLLEVAIDQTNSIAAIEYLDLRVISCNEPALALYRSKKFEEVRRIPDMFRIDGEPVDDIFMTLRVSR